MEWICDNVFESFNMVLLAVTIPKFNNLHPSVSMSPQNRYQIGKQGAMPPGITKLLRDWSDGNQQALDELIASLYDYLHAEAKRHLDKLNVRGDSLQATALVNEAYMKFRKSSKLSFLNRQQFFWFSSQMIRHIIVDHIRSRTRQKRRNDKVPLNEEIHSTTSAPLTPGVLDPTTLLAINRALSELETTNQRRCQIVTLRFIMGMSIQETANVMEISLTTVKSEWAAAKLWLFKKLNTAFG